MSAARRFFVEGAKETGNVVDIAGSDAHKIEHVLRLKAGDGIVVIDSSARTFSAEILETGRIVRVRIGDEAPVERSGALLQIDVAQAVPKGQRMEFVIEKGTELGVEVFLPFVSERSVSREVGAEKLSRWRRIARTAAQQCGRKTVAQVADPFDFDALLARFSEYDAVLFAWELAAAAPLHGRLREAVPAAGRVLVVVGPEGGFTHAEADLAAGRGAAMLWLGPRVLRTDTAALVMLAVIGSLAS
ncbi:MAG TPA: 16S rRNA (uracil(1498)-N(3))-methyltransferase [Candidatus Cybelea sp.]|nr:16S rRNA (uracil(1498)-N(3))-methyltransferase [Candidatus Cybelea sp.]